MKKRSKLGDLKMADGKLTGDDETKDELLNSFFKLKKLKITKSAGPDGFHPRVLSEISLSIKLPLSIIFTQLYDEGRLPSDWKNARITPIHKKESKAIPANYRPVSLTSVIGKMMESVIRDSLVKHMIASKLFCDQQHGFVTGRSYMTQLLVILKLWTKLIARQWCRHRCDLLGFQKSF
ncbi:hypothetical protein LSH36_253g03018 [Paralvinella palmiformis]|uniref:Reverse transcriptase domain-containing protein n=1 Tax=Paralvinella palmiformis TaxID=53620 RepID=A0AAD9JLG0_9ANNE|nr:hypothetical protein LSH36_253g03018 [Paralvinella palmiformis]